MKGNFCPDFFVVNFCTGTCRHRLIDIYILVVSDTTIEMRCDLYNYISLCQNESKIITNDGTVLATLRNTYISILVLCLGWIVRLIA